jgi:hypothetical protein
VHAKRLLDSRFLCSACSLLVACFAPSRANTTAATVTLSPIRDRAGRRHSFRRHSVSLSFIHPSHAGLLSCCDIPTEESETSPGLDGLLKHIPAQQPPTNTTSLARIHTTSPGRRRRLVNTMAHNAFHHEHTHGRVFHGLEARDLLHMEKRDSHGDKPKMHVPSPPEPPKHEKPDNRMNFIHNKPELKIAQKAAGPVVETVYSQVYVTETPTGDGPIVGYTTQTAAPTPAGGDDDAAAKSLQEQQASYLSAKSAAQAPNTTRPNQVASSSDFNTKPTQRTRTTEPSQHPGTPLQQTRASTQAPTSSAELENAGVVGVPQTRTREPTAVGGTPLSATHSGSVISEKSEGMTAGAKAGLAFGIIIAIALAAGLVFFCWRRKKQQDKAGEQWDEKRGTKDSFFGGSAAAAARGPQRESIQSEKSFATTRTAATAPRLSLRPVTQFLPNILGGGQQNNNNGNNLDVPAMSEKPRSNPFDDSARPVSPNNPFEDGDGAVAAAKGHSQNNSWEGSEPPTPKSTKFGTAAAVPITSGGKEGPRGPNNVHRVQLDFKPSMEDELELRSGQLVRMLHEYDDGWVSNTTTEFH